MSGSFMTVCSDGLRRHPGSSVFGGFSRWSNAGANRRKYLCVFCHGLGGSKEDWRTWVDCLTRLCPNWILKVCESVTEGSIPVIGAPLDRLADLLADEVVEAINELRQSDADIPITLHCVGHSMGGILIRGALPRIFRQAPTFEPGVFMSLSCPHLGVQASWGAPSDMWRNLSWTLRVVSPQIPQLAIQDRSQEGGAPYLVSLATEEQYIAALRRFQRRICLTMGCKDIVIPTASGSLWAERKWDEPVPPSGQVAAWGFEAISRHVPDDSHAEVQTPTMEEADWMESADGTSWFPRQALEGLLKVGWERIVIRLQLPLTKQAHIFTIGKASMQGHVEGIFSKECVEHIAQGVLVAASNGSEIQIDMPCWMTSLKKQSVQPCEIGHCFGRWTVATEEGVGNVKFYRFTRELDAKQYFDGLGWSSKFYHISRILFDPHGHEQGRAGSNLVSFSTIRKGFVGPSPDCRFDGSWIIAAEHGIRNVKFYHLQTEDLARRFLATGFHLEARILFSPEGEEITRAGWNVCAKYTLSCAMEEMRRRHFS